MRKEIAILLLSFPLFSYGDISISSEGVRLEGKKLKLQKIEIDHKIGKISAQKGSFKRGSILSLKDDIHLSLKEGGVLRSDQAIIDIANSKIFFSAEDKISFSLPLTKPLTIKSSQVKCTLEDLNTNNISSNLKTIEFFDDLEISYYKLHVYGKEANYRYNKGKGEFSLIPHKNDLCLFKYKNNQVTAKAATFQVAKKNLFLKKVQGTIYPTTPYHPLFFYANSLSWQGADEKLLLKGDININNTSLGKIKTEELEIEKDLKKIKMRGKTIINFSPHHQDLNLTFYCQGEIELDLPKQRILATTEKKGELKLHDGNTTIYAKRAFFDYLLEKSKFIPKEFRLENDVRFISKKKKHSRSFGIADKISYFPNHKSIILSSQSKNKVLLWQNNDMQISAHEIKITLQEKTKKDVIQGIGKVRFSFTLDEKNFLRKIISKYMDFR